LGMWGGGWGCMWGGGGKGCGGRGRGCVGRQVGCVKGGEGVVARGWVGTWCGGVGQGKGKGLEMGGGGGWGGVLCGGGWGCVGVLSLPVPGVHQEVAHFKQCDRELIRPRRLNGARAASGGARLCLGLSRVHAGKHCPAEPTCHPRPRL